MRNLVLLLLVLGCIALASAALATEYQVGAGQQYATINDLLLVVTLGDNDIVWVHPGTYPAFWVKTGGGSSQAAAVQIRAWDPNNKPIFNAAGANNCAQFEDPDSVYGLVGKWFYINGLEITGAASRGIYNVSCNLIVRNCYVHDNNNGYMGGWHNCRDAERGDAIFEYNEFYRNGSGAYAHQLYMEGYNAEFRYNWVHENTGGLPYKDRSRNSIVEYNYIEQGPNGYYGFEFCGFDDNAMPDIPQYATVIGNVFLKNAGQNAWLFLANERSEGNPNNFQSIGYLTMVNNTCYSQNHTGPMLAGDDGSIITAHNNIFQSTTCNRIMDKIQKARTWGQVLTSYNNWVNSQMTIPSGFTGTVFGTNPGWVNGVWPLGDYHLAAGSQCINAGRNDVGGLPAKEYSQPCNWVARASDGAIDIGAFEYSSAPAPPVANFTGNPTSGPAPLTVMFTDTSTGSPTSWSWTFGDGGTSAAQNPSHIYNTANQYTVSLTATNAQGSDTETKTNYITVVQAQDYFCNSLTVNTGTIQSGDHTSVHSSNDVYLVVKSAKSGGKQVEQVTYTFNTGLGSLSSLSFAVEGKVSAGTQPQTVYVYNYSTSAWDSKSTSTLTTSDTTASAAVTSPGSYISGGTVQVRVKTGGSGSTVYNHSTDLVKITAAP